MVEDDCDGYEDENRTDKLNIDGTSCLLFIQDCKHSDQKLEVVYDYKIEFANHLANFGRKM